jgi:hypothetical protein
MRLLPNPWNRLQVKGFKANALFSCRHLQSIEVIASEALGVKEKELD